MKCPTCGLHHFSPEKIIRCIRCGYEFTEDDRRQEERKNFYSQQPRNGIKGGDTDA